MGIATGLAWTPLGVATLVVEATRVHDAARGFQLTGQLGGVMKESAEIAYSYVAANAARFGAAPQFFANASIHLHVPEGATPKDGPSAGITMASALLSLARARPWMRSQKPITRGSPRMHSSPNLQRAPPRRAAKVAAAASRATHRPAASTARSSTARRSSWSSRNSTA